MRASEAFNKGKEDGRSGREPKPVGGKTSYLVGYHQGRGEWDQVELSRRLKEMHSQPKEFISTSPKLTRGVVWCLRCGESINVNAARCLAHGWPKCCGQTMTIDSPKERKTP